MIVQTRLDTTFVLTNALKLSAGSVQATIEAVCVHRCLTCQWMTSTTKMFFLIGKSMQVRYVL